MRFYRALLHLYPASFGSEYGREMLAIFRKRYQQSPGLSAKVILWLETITDSTDTVTFASAAVLSFVMAAAGSLVPALRAVRVDPIAVTRSE